MLKCNLKGISPTSLATFYKDPKRFVDTYVLGGQRMAQTKPMAIGSAFDVYIKLFLLDETEEWFQKEFNRSVEKPHREWALVEGKKVFEMYQKSGALNNLMTEIAGAEVQCEFKTKHDVIYEDGYSVPLRGIPDLMFLKGDLGLIVDWKVTGFMTKASPAHGYASCYKDGFNLGAHRSMSPMRYKGVLLGLGANIREDWMTQITMYTWAALPQGCEPIVGIDQLAFKNLSGKYQKGGERELRVAVFRTEINEEFQTDLKARLRKAWEMISCGHYFSDKTKEENDERMAFLENADEQTLWAIRGGR